MSLLPRSSTLASVVTPVLVAITSLFGALGLAGCGASSTTPPPASSQKAEAPTGPTSSTVAFKPTRKYSGEMNNNGDGSTAEIRLDVGEVFDADDSDFPTAFKGAVASCVVDEARDVLIPIRVTVTSTTERFASEFSAGIRVTGFPVDPDEGDPTIEIGADFTDGPRCSRVEYRLVGSHVTFPEMVKGESNAQDFVAIVHNYYSPRFAAGNKTAIENLMLTPTSNRLDIRFVKDSETKEWVEPTLIKQDHE